MAESVLPVVETTQKSVTRTSGTLVRSIGLLGTTVFGVHAISLSSSGLIAFSTVAGQWPTVDLGMMLTIAMLLCVMYAYTYAVIGVVNPVSGADYVLTTRMFGGPIGFVASWTLVIFSALVAGALIVAIPQSTIPTFLRTVGILSNNPDWLTFAEQAAQPQNVVAVSTAGVVLAFALTLLNPKTVQRIFQVGLVLVLVAWAILYFQLGSAAQGSFPAAWDRFMGQGAYVEHLENARALGSAGTFSAATSMLAGVMGFWIFYGYSISTHFAGEVKDPERSLLGGSLLSLVITWAVFLVSTLLIARLIPREWVAAESYLYLSGDKTAMPWITFYAAIVRPSFPLIIIVAVAWIYTLVNLVQAYFFYCSRIVLAWAQDGLMPEIASYIHPRAHTPVAPLFFVAVISLFGVVATVQSSSSSLNFLFFLVAAQLAPILAITLYPFLRREQFEANSSRLVRAHIGKLPVITLVGGLTFIYLVWLLVAAFIFPTLGNAVDTTNLWTLLGFAASGLVWYYVRSSFLRRQGINLKDRFKRMPGD